MEESFDPWGNPNMVIKVIGVGGGGGNAVNRMIEDSLDGVEFISVNTDVQVLRFSKAEKRIQIGYKITNGMGAGADPELGRKAAEETKDVLRESLENTQLLFITAGMGGGTGTGASPIIAKIAKELGVLTIAIVTKPFDFEGIQRKNVALNGLKELRENVDGLVVIPNQRLFKIKEGKISISNAFKVADEILKKAVQGITELIRTPGIINLDYRDLKNLISSFSVVTKNPKKEGTIWIGMGSARGDDRAVRSVKNAISYDLLEYSMKGAKGVIYNVIGKEVSMEEMDMISSTINRETSKDAKIIFGYAEPQDNEDSSESVVLQMSDEIRVTVIATGLDDGEFQQETEQFNPKEFALEDLEIPAYLRKNFGGGGR